MKRFIAAWTVVAAVAATGCVADVETGEDGAGGARESMGLAEDIGEAQDPILGYNCDEACTAALLVHLRFCSNRDFVSPRLHGKCTLFARTASNACYFTTPDQGCQKPCAASHDRFNLFCPSIPQAKRYHCRERNETALAECLAAGSMSFRR